MRYEFVSKCNNCMGTLGSENGRHERSTIHKAHISFKEASTLKYMFELI